MRIPQIQQYFVNLTNRSATPKMHRYWLLLCVAMVTITGIASNHYSSIVRTAERHVLVDTMMSASTQAKLNLFAKLSASARKEAELESLDVNGYKDIVEDSKKSLEENKQLVLTYFRVAAVLNLGFFFSLVFLLLNVLSVCAYLKKLSTGNRQQ